VILILKRLLPIALAAALAIFAIACGDDDDNGDSDNGGATTPAATEQGGTVTTAYNAEPEMTIDENKRYFATIKMDIGDIKLELFPKDAPHHVNSFVFLSREGFYDNVTFHRVIPGFVAQAGDPTGTGTGGPGYTIQDEVNSRTFEDGTLGMAKTSAPNSAGSQWFICYAPQPNLNGGYTVFGQLVEGRDVLDKITPRDPQVAQAPGTKINTIEIEEQ
jgi:cyclophilin family peptidyl-prolyl cis-trans isomerase